MVDPAAQTTQMVQWLDRMRAGDAAARDELIRGFQGRLEALARKMVGRDRRVGRWVDAETSSRTPCSACSCPGVGPARLDAGLLRPGRRANAARAARPGPALLRPGGRGRESRQRGAAGRRQPPGPRSRLPRTRPRTTWSGGPGSMRRSSTLPVREREVVGLVFYHGWTQAQVAELFGVDVRTVRRWWEVGAGEAPPRTQRRVVSVTWLGEQIEGIGEVPWHPTGPSMNWCNAGSPCTSGAVRHRRAVMRDCPEAAPEVEERLRAVAAMMEFMGLTTEPVDGASIRRRLTPGVREARPRVRRTLRNPLAPTFATWIAANGSSRPPEVKATNCSNSSPKRTACLSPPAVIEQFGRYRLLRLLGQGAFGHVYLAYDEELQRHVAIKVPTPERFQKPRRCGVLPRRGPHRRDPRPPQHRPGLRRGPHRGRLGLRRLQVHRRTDARRADHGAGRLADEASRLVATVARALHHAHRKRLVHRDVKPANILIDENRQAFVADFGLALSEEDFGKGTMVAGTPAYMSPEQARGEGHRVDGRSRHLQPGRRLLRAPDRAAAVPRRAP